MTALDTAVRSGRALYAGISSYSAGEDAGGRDDRARARHAAADPPAVVLDAQPLDRGGPARRARGAGDGLHRVLAARPGAADRPLPRRRPARTRARPAATAPSGATTSTRTPLRTYAAQRDRAARGQKLAQLALQWALRDQRVTSAVIGASSVEQLDTNLDALDGPPLTDDELAAIDQDAVDAGINLWASRPRTEGSRGCALQPPLALLVGRQGGGADDAGGVAQGRGDDLGVDLDQRDELAGRAC